MGKGCDSTTIKGQINASRRKKVLFISALLAILAVSSFVSMGVGAVMVPLSDVLRSVGHALFPGNVSGPDPCYYSAIIVNYRIPRVLLAILAGMSLAVAGVVMQGVLRNPLVSPFTLGLSSASSFGAAFSLLVGPVLLGSMYYQHLYFMGNAITLGWILMILLAFGSGLVSIMILLLLTRNRNISQSVLVLSGVVIGYLFQAALSYLKYLSDDSNLREIVNWLMGGMWGASWSAVIILIPIVMVTTILLELCAVDLNGLAAGPEVARSLGIDVVRLRRYALLISAFATSACLAFTGIIGFIGLMAPHICRAVIGNDHRYLIPAAAVLGAIILMVSDAVSRVIQAPLEVPVGIIMYCIGGVFFIVLVTRMSGGYES